MAWSITLIPAFSHRGRRGCSLPFLWHAHHEDEAQRLDTNSGQKYNRGQKYNSSIGVATKLAIDIGFAGDFMAANAYILINIEPAKTQAVVERLRTISGAIVQEVMGPYDVVVELQSDTPEDITAILRHKIRSVNGVTNTVTCTWI